MAILTLTTDWCNNDYYVGAIKGKILSKDPTTVTVDISHQIAPFSVMQAAFVLRNCYKEYPAGTIHIVGVSSVLTSKRALLIVEKDGQYFLCSDSGFPDLLFPEEEKNVYVYRINKEEGNTFSSLNFYVDVAFRLVEGESPADIALETDKYVHQIPLLPTIDTNLINGSVVYIDSFSNAITNISRELFDRVGENKRYDIFVQSNHNKITYLSKTYSDMPTGELIALFNSAGMLEIAVVNGPAAQLLNLQANAVVRIKFTEKKAHNQLFLSGE